VTEKKRGRPATGETPIRGVRVPDGLWNAAKDKAEEEGTTVSDVVNTCLTKYVAKKKK
jgi:antitoxin component of RelBE/YafQ-DinJ toxin-antitoxin module